MWMWSQGDAHRSRRREVAQEKEKNRERHHSVSNLLTGVDDMRIHDAVEIDNRYNNYDNVSLGDTLRSINKISDNVVSGYNDVDASITLFYTTAGDDDGDSDSDDDNEDYGNINSDVNNDNDVFHWL